MGKKSRNKKHESTQMGTQINTNRNAWEWIFFIGIIVIVILPLLNFPPLFSPPDFGKAIIFRIIVSILLFLFVVKSLFSKSFGRGYVPKKGLSEAAEQGPRLAGSAAESGAVPPRWRRELRTFFGTTRAPFVSLAVLFFVFFLATIFSVDPHHSLFDTPYRNGGSLNFFFYIIFAVLVFFTIKDEKKWQKIWIAALIAGLLISFVGIEQKFGFLYKIFHQNFIIYRGYESPSTLGGPIFFGNYLLTLIFVFLSFGLKEGRWKWRIFYILSSLILIFTLIFCAEKRGPLAGLAVGCLWFFFFYPKKAILLKSSTIIIFILVIFGFYYLSSHHIYFIEGQPLIEKMIGLFSKMSPSLETLGSRYQSWRVSFGAIKEKPILGWGPENFSIAFDKYYDPSLPGLQKDPETHASWWDRAHNFLIDYAISAGILGLLAFLGLLGTVFWQLQRLKPPTKLRINYEYTNNNSILAHGVQTTFLAYFTALLFSFDTPPTYIIFFLLIGFSLYLIQKETYTETHKTEHKKTQKNSLCKSVFLSVLFCVLIWFIWGLNIKPLKINEKINVAVARSEAKNCEGAMSIMENLLKNRSILDDYLRLKYIGILDNCIKQESENSLNFAKRAWEISKENTKIRPSYVRNWIFFDGYTNMLIEAETNQENIKKLKEGANLAFEKAAKLSPKRQEIYLEWIKTDLLTGEYQKADEKVQKCIELNPKESGCYWLKDLTDIYLGDFEKIHKKYLPSYRYMPAESLLQFAKVFNDVKYYPPLMEIYQILVERAPNDIQFRASLAFVYKELGEYDKAREEAVKIFELEPAAKADVEKFLKNLPAD